MQCVDWTKARQFIKSQAILIYCYDEHGIHNLTCFGAYNIPWALSNGTCMNHCWARWPVSFCRPTQETTLASGHVVADCHNLADFSVPSCAGRRALAQFRFGSSFSVVCGHCLVTLTLTINETLKWFSSLPILLMKSFWCWQCSDSYMYIYIISLCPSSPISIRPSLISLMVSVDTKHHERRQKLWAPEDIKQNTW